MFKKLAFRGLNYRDLDRFDSHDLKRDEIKSFYQTFDFIELVKKWPEIVGPKMAQVTSPLKLKQDSLFVITKHASYSHELSYLGEDIKREIFKALPNLRPILKKLVFQTQEAYFRPKEEVKGIGAADPVPKLHPQSPQYKLLRAEAERLFQDVADEDLRSLMISIFMQSKSV